MKNNKKIYSFFLFLFFIFANANSHESVAYINLDRVFNDSETGKKIIAKLNLINEKNLKEINLEKNKLKQKEEKLFKEKNILSQETFNSNFEKLKREIESFNNNNIESKKKITKVKNEELNNFLEKIQPILNNYMEQNSINILIDKKNIFIGQAKLDITDVILDILNKKIN